MNTPILFALICSIGWGIGTIFDKKATKELNPHTCFVLKTIFYLFCGLALSYFTFDEIAADLKLVKNNSKHQSAFFYLLIGCVITALIGTVFYYKAMKSSNGKTTRRPSQKI